MGEIMFYAIESILLLSFFYALYRIFLSNETFFQLNRIVLLAIPLTSMLLPLLRFRVADVHELAADRPMQQLSSMSKSLYDAMASWEFEVRAGDTLTEQSSSGISWLDFTMYFLIFVYIGGVLICLSRTAWSIRWILHTLAKNPVVEKDGIKIVRLETPTAPFSFLNYVFVHAPLVESEDFPQILKHERTHIEEKHTIDLLYFQIVAAFLWFNPVIWQLFKSLKTTHEYIADRKIIQSGYSVSAYQTLLLRQLISNNSSELVHNFNLSFIKKRITMMTNKQSGWAGRVKAGSAIVVMLLCSLVVMRCNSKIEEEDIELLKNENGVAEIDVPTLPPSGYHFGDGLNEALTLTIANNKLRIGEVEAEVSEIANIRTDEYGRKLPMIMMIDKDQKMGFVRKVHTALREADRRKMLYIGQTASGDHVEVMLILPPPASTGLLPDISQVPDEHLLKIDLSKNDGETHQQMVYNFVMSYVNTGTAELGVVSADMDDDDSYDSYLSNIFHIKEGYIRVYQERARRMFGKDFYKTTEEEYRAVRENIPMNISVAED